MACTLTKGRNEPCKDVVGGITAVYFADFDSLGAITYDVTDTDVIDSFGGTPTWFKFEVKGNSSFEQTITSSRENGTVFFDQAVTLSLPQLSKEDNNELKLLDMADLDGSKNVRVVMRYTAGVQIGIGADIVYYT